MSFADQYVERFEPWWTQDLEDYLRAQASMFEQVELYAFDTDDYEGWTILYDPDRCPYEALPHLAQYVGERLPTGIIDPAAREWLRDAPNKIRGTVLSLVWAAQRTLTGQRTVRVLERSADVDTITVVTYSAETPSEAAVLADLLTVVPADLILDYDMRDGQSWTDAFATPGVTTWADFAAEFPTWEDAQEGTPGITYNTFTRLRPW